MPLSATEALSRPSQNATIYLSLPIEEAVGAFCVNGWGNHGDLLTLTVVAPKAVLQL
jgi:hypothetical protein